MADSCNVVLNGGHSKWGSHRLVHSLREGGVLNGRLWCVLVELELEHLECLGVLLQTSKELWLF